LNLLPSSSKDEGASSFLLAEVGFIYFFFRG